MRDLASPASIAGSADLFAMLDDHHRGAHHPSVRAAADARPARGPSRRRPRPLFRPPYVGPGGWVGVVLDDDPDWGMVAHLVEAAFGVSRGRGFWRSRRHRSQRRARRPNVRGLGERIEVAFLNGPAGPLCTPRCSSSSLVRTLHRRIRSAQRTEARRAATWRSGIWGRKSLPNQDGTRAVLPGVRAVRP
jgi:hypothetical protein